MRLLLIIIILPKLIFPQSLEKKTTNIKVSLISLTYVFLKDQHYSASIERHLGYNAYQLGFLTSTINTDYRKSASIQIIPEYRYYFKMGGFYFGGYLKLQKNYESLYLKYDINNNLLPLMQTLSYKCSFAKLAIGPLLGYQKHLSSHFLIECGVGIGGRFEVYRKVKFGNDAISKRIELDGAIQLNIGYAF